MSTPYETWRYIFPPRTNSKIPWNDKIVLPLWRKYSETIAQFKLNGNRNIIAVSPESNIRFWTRHVDDAKHPIEQKYEIPEIIRKKILDVVPQGKWSLLDSELMHTKTVDVKNVLYIYDVLVWNNEYLTGENYAQRNKRISGKFDGPLPVDGSMLPQNSVYLAQWLLEPQWNEAWEIAKKTKYIEGLVLKRTGPVSRLEEAFTPVNNGGFMCRIRKSNKNSLF